MTITLEELKNAVKDIKADDEWVNDSHTKAEHRGVCRGLDMLVNHFEEVKTYAMNDPIWDKRWTR
jgi:hypothetical protein